MKKSITILSILLMFIIKINCQNVGISDNTSFVPSSMLHIRPSASYAGSLFSVQNSTGLYAIHATLNCNIGIGTSTPTEKLQVSGNIRFSGALMPNNLAGTSGNILTSSGAGIAPKWSTFTIGNPGATTIIAKYYSSLSWTDYWYSGTIMTFTITDSDCRNQSCISVAIDGPWNTLYSGIVICNVVCENGQFRITAINQSGFDLAGGIPISFIAFY